MPPLNPLPALASDDLATWDRAWMTRALALAERGVGYVEPNPMVGCVIVRDDLCIGEGFHRRCGGDHAEVDALKSLGDPRLATGATAYVTLEPCCHYGKTPPCTEALLAAGVQRVVVAMRDPFPQVDGGGIQRLRRAGVTVDVGIEQAAAEDLNAPYLKRLQRHRPWVIAKWAMTLDGRIATVSGDSQWISGELSRGEVHRLRGRVDAVIVGGGTAAADNPTLTARPAGPRTALRVVFVGQRLPAWDSNLIQSVDAGPVMFVTGPDCDPSSLTALGKRGVEVLKCQAHESGEQVRELLDELGRRQMTNVLLEGGARLIASFAAIDEVDEIHTFLAAKIVGGVDSPGPIGGSGISKLADSVAYRLRDVARFDEDVRVIVRRVREQYRLDP